MSDPPPVTGSGSRTVAGRYQLIREIGRGGVATVYLSRQIDLDRLVALKELTTFHVSAAGSTDRFLRESRLAGSLSHPNIVTVFDYFEDGGVPYIVMEYLPRGSLRPHLRQLSEARLAGVLEGVLAGLACAESSGIVHRDLKPENILVTADGHVKVADFGIAKAAEQVGVDSFVTAPGITVGTPSYMAPEQAMGQDVGPWTDLYSLGVMIWEHLVGHVPFHETDTPIARVLRHVNEQIPAPAEVNPDVDPALSGWVAGLLVNDRRMRTQSAAQAWNGLEEIVVTRLGPLWRRDARLLDENAPVPPGDRNEDMTDRVSIVPVVEPSITEVRVPSVIPLAVTPDQPTSSDKMDPAGDLAEQDADPTDVIYLRGLAQGELPHEPSQPPTASDSSSGRGVEIALSAPALSVAMGQAGDCEVLVTNSGTVADEYILTSKGAPTRFATLDTARLHLDAGEQQGIHLRFTPRGDEGEPGVMPFYVLVVSANDSRVSSRVDGTVNLGAIPPRTEPPPTADTRARRGGGEARRGRPFSLRGKWWLVALVVAVLFIGAIIEPVVLPGGTVVRTAGPVNVDNGAGRLVEHVARPTTFHVDCKVTSGPVAGYYRETKAWWHFWRGDKFVPPAFARPTSTKNC
jgi:serine/threonine protein kinase